MLNRYVNSIKENTNKKVDGGGITLGIKERAGMDNGMNGMDYDVAIIGNGIAANAFARHLVLTDRRLKVLIIGSRETPKYAVGESITEVASHFLQHRLGLTRYLYTHQLFKNGLRFFFDSPNKDVRIQDMSEQGAARFPLYNSFHLDRFSFENDLKEMNAKEGVHFKDQMAGDIIFEHALTRIVLDDGSQISTRWLIDATGMKGVIAQKLGLRQEVENNVHCSVWGHFKAVNKIDDLDQEWRRKTVFTTREFSTIQFVCDGYWIWVIPIKDSTISCGIVYDRRAIFSSKSPEKEEFISFLNSHRALREMFDKSEIVNFKHLEDFAYATQEFIGLDKRVALISDAATFVDPMYSPGLDMLARQSEIYTKIIKKDVLEGGSGEDLPLVVKKANLYLKYNVAFYRNLILGNNACLGSCEIFGLKYFWELFMYYLNVLWPYVAQKDLPGGPVEAMEERLVALERVISLVTGNFQVLAEEFKTRQLYYRKNTNWRQFSLPGVYFERLIHKRWSPQIKGQRKVMLAEFVQFILLSQLELMFERKDLVCDKEAVECLTFERIVSFGKGAGDNNRAFFEKMGGVLREQEKTGDSFSFWNHWLAIASMPYQTKCSGVAFSKLKEGLAMMDVESMVSTAHRDEWLARISQEFMMAKSDPRGYLQNRDDRPMDERCKPFIVEGISAGLVANGMDVKSVINMVSQKAGMDMMPLVWMGCGVGSVGVNPDLIFNGYVPTESEMDLFLDGFGFGVGLARIFEARELVFPSYPKRNPMVRGLGRCVTFAPGDNSFEKYDAYFRFFELFPQDREEFFSGVGFSLGFVKEVDGVKEVLATFEGKKEEYDNVKRGVSMAKSLRDGMKGVVQVDGAEQISKQL